MEKGTTTQRGYGHIHQRTRAYWAPIVKRGEVPCARCGLLIPPGAPWDLGHMDGDRTRYQGPEHRRCNRSAGATAGNRHRNHPNPSRRW